MSTRILAPLTAAAVALALTGGIAAANAALPPPPPDGMGPPSVSPSASLSPSASPSPSGTASPGKEEAALAECLDADCEVEIKDGQEIALDEKYGVEPVKVKVNGEQVTFVVRTHNSQAITTVDAGRPGTSATFNGLTLRPHMTEDGKLMLDVSHT